MGPMKAKVAVATPVAVTPLLSLLLLPRESRGTCHLGIKRSSMPSGASELVCILVLSMGHLLSIIFSWEYC